MKSFVLMVTFLTRIPLKINFEINDDDFTKGIWYMPVIGLLIGIILYGLYFIASQFFSPIVTSAIIIIIYIFITGGLHLDGLADTSDAVFSYRSRERMLEIMKDSHIGTFGVVAIVLYLLGMAAILTDRVPEACLFFPLIGRSASLLSCASNSYARTSGMGKSIIDGTKPKHVIFSIILTVISAAALYFISKNATASIIVIIAFATSMISMFAITRSISRKLGGITGDVIGFVIETSSLIYVAIYYVSMVVAGLI